MLPVYMKKVRRLPVVLFGNTVAKKSSVIRASRSRDVSEHMHCKYNTCLFTRVFDEALAPVELFSEWRASVYVTQQK